MMEDRSLLEALLAVRSGMAIDRYRALVGSTRLPPVQQDVAVADDPIPYQEFAHLDVTVTFDSEQTHVESIGFGPDFKGDIRGISIGMTGDEVENLLGPCGRTWPMPHPNYILIYDHPDFLRIDLSRSNERVISIYR